MQSVKIKGENVKKEAMAGQVGTNVSRSREMLLSMLMSLG
jgi:hypothetical protein